MSDVVAKLEAKPGRLARLWAWLFPEPDPVDVGRVQVKVTFVDGRKVVKTFTGWAYLFRACTPFIRSASAEARTWIGESDPILMPGGEFVPRTQVLRYELGTQEPYLAVPQR